MGLLRAVRPRGFDGLSRAGQRPYRFDFYNPKKCVNIPVPQRSPLSACPLTPPLSPLEGGEGEGEGVFSGL